MGDGVRYPRSLTTDVRTPIPASLQEELMNYTDNGNYVVGNPNWNGRIGTRCRQPGQSWLKGARREAMRYLLMAKYNENGTPPPQILLDALEKNRRESGLLRLNLVAVPIKAYPVTKTARRRSSRCRA